MAGAVVAVPIAVTPVVVAAIVRIVGRPVLEAPVFPIVPFGDAERETLEHVCLIEAAAAEYSAFDCCRAARHPDRVARGDRPRRVAGSEQPEIVLAWSRGRVERHGRG